MGNDVSLSRKSNGDGIPFVEWGNTLHFAEPSCYIYTPIRNYVYGEVVFADPPEADLKLKNQTELVGRIVIVERSKRAHFPDVMSRLFAAGVIGCIFIETTENNDQKSIFEGFHSSGRQKVTIPIVRLSKKHTDQLLQEKPSRIAIRMIHGINSIEHLIPEDVSFAIAVAARHGEKEVLAFLLSKLHKKQRFEGIPAAMALCDAVENGHTDYIEIMHDMGVSLDEQNLNGKTALMKACSLGNIEALRALLMYGTSLDLEDAHGMTALMIAAREKQTDALKLLIRKGASVELSRNRKRGTTALHIAARSGSPECIKVLLAAKVTIDTESLNSTTALMEAARAGHLQCVKLLAEAGASLEMKDTEGHTAQMFAKEACHREIEDYLRSLVENDIIRGQRLSISGLANEDGFSLQKLFELGSGKEIGIDVLKYEIRRNKKLEELLETQQIILEVFRLMIAPPETISLASDPVFGKYKSNYFCSELILWYGPEVYGDDNFGEYVVDEKRCFGYFSVLFIFLRQTGTLDDVILVLFCKVLTFLIQSRNLGETILHYLSTTGKDVVSCIARHIGSDSICDAVLWLLYSGLSDKGQEYIVESGLLKCLIDRLITWQRTLCWDIGTAYQRDAVENICHIIGFIVQPPFVSIVGDTSSFIKNCDGALPSITDNSPAGRHNALFRTLLLEIRDVENCLETFIKLGLAELHRQVDRTPKHLISEGGSLCIVKAIMDTLGYHKVKRNRELLNDVLLDVRSTLIRIIPSYALDLVSLIHTIVKVDDPIRSPRGNLLSRNGNALISVVAFLKRAIFLQSQAIDKSLADSGLMPSLLSCFIAHPNNNLLHHKLTDIIRFILLDPSQKRLPSCPLLHSLFANECNILNFVIHRYNEDVQYKGHLTTIANSISTLSCTPVCVTINTENSREVTTQEVVCKYVRMNDNWKKFERKLITQNRRDSESFGKRNAPLCDGCLRLKEESLSYVTLNLDPQILQSGYIEKIFSDQPSHHCRINVTPDFITGFMYKKDKKHDHIPIPEPTPVTSFIQYPVSMPFHALTFTITYFALCRKCDKLWYCDTLQSANWPNRMKWVMVTSVKKWYSFGTSQSPISGAHGIEFSTRGYKNFLILTDTWGRQEQWIQGLQEAISGSVTRSGEMIAQDHALAIEIDNET